MVPDKDIGAIQVQLAASLDLVKSPTGHRIKWAQIFLTRKPAETTFTGKQDGE